MSTSRRRFLKSGTMLALAAGVSGGLNTALNVSARELSFGSLSPLTKSSFEPNLNSTFLIRADGSQSFKLKLAEIADLKRYKKGKAITANKEGFSLLFDGPSGIPQNTYSFNHDKMGKFDLLLVPIERRKKKGHSYEVVINRLFA